MPGGTWTQSAPLTSRQHGLNSPAIICERLMTNDTIAARRLGRWDAFFSALFGLGHLAWAAGLRILGATDEQFELVGQGSAAHILTEGGIGLSALVASFLTLALVERWGAKVPRLLLRLTILTG